MPEQQKDILLKECISCGKPIVTLGSKFCSSCGYNFNTGETGERRDARMHGKKTIAERLSVGDVIVSQNGTQRRVLAVEPSGISPEKRFFKFERIGKGGEVTEEIFSSDKLEKVEKNIDKVIWANEDDAHKDGGTAA